MTAKDDLPDEATHARALAARLRALDFAESDPPSGLRALESALDAFAGGASAKAARSQAWAEIAKSVAALAAALESEQRARAVDRMRLSEGLRWVSGGMAETERLAARVAGLEGEVQAREADVRSRDARVAGLEGEVRARDGVIAAANAQAQELAGRVSRLEGELEAMRTEVRARDARIAELATEGARVEAEEKRLEVELAQLGEETMRLRAIVAQPGHRLVTRMGATLERHPRVGAMLSAIVRWLNRLFDRSGP